MAETAKEREDKLLEAIKPALDDFDNNISEISKLSNEEQISALWATVRALYERALRLEYEKQRSLGLFF